MQAHHEDFETFWRKKKKKESKLAGREDQEVEAKESESRLRMPKRKAEAEAEADALSSLFYSCLVHRGLEEHWMTGQYAAALQNQSTPTRPVSCSMKHHLCMQKAWPPERFRQMVARWLLK